MAINSNLVFAKDFLRPVQKICTELYQKTWSAENRVLYSSRIEQLFEAGVEKDIIISIKPSFIKDFTATEKEFIYEVIRGVSLEYPEIRYLLDDLERLFKQRGYQNERYFYLSQLTDNQFAYELDSKLTKGYKSRRDYYRKLSNYFGKNHLTLSEVLEKYFFTDFIELNRPRPKRKVRHKGYRDHGSLGSEFSKTLKQQSSDWSLREAEEKRIRKKQDIHKFLLGFAGWE